MVIFALMKKTMFQEDRFCNRAVSVNIFEIYLLLFWFKVFEKVFVPIIATKV